MNTTLTPHAHVHVKTNKENLNAQVIGVEELSKTNGTQEKVAAELPIEKATRPLAK